MIKTLNVKEVADVLRLNPVTVRKMITDGEIGASKLGKSFVVIENDLLDYLVKTKVRKNS